MKAVRFAIVGLGGACIDFSAFYLLERLIQDHILARVLAFWLAASATWVGHKFYTFKCFQFTHLFKQWLKHFASAHAAGVINITTYITLSSFVASYFAVAAGILAGALSNFVFASFWVFKRQSC